MLCQGPKPGTGAEEHPGLELTMITSNKKYPEKKTDFYKEQN